MGLRQERLADQIRDLLATCFLGGQLSDPRLNEVTITYVKLTPDLQLATVYYRTYDKGKSQEAMAGLDHSRGFLRRHLADNLSLRRVPDLRFFYDESVEHGARIEELLRDIKKP